MTPNRLPESNQGGHSNNIIIPVAHESHEEFKRALITSLQRGGAVYGKFLIHCFPSLRIILQMSCSFNIQIILLKV